MNEESVDLDFEISVTSTVIYHLMRTSLQTFLDMLISTIRKNLMMTDDEEQPTDCISKPVFKVVMNAITVLEDYSLFSNFGTYLMKALMDVNGAFDLDCLSNKKQSTIKGFFQTS